jgi:serine/threonine protein kinase
VTLFLIFPITYNFFLQLTKLGITLEELHRNTLPKGFHLEEYIIDSILGKPGGFGITYLATDNNLKQMVAIKEYLPSDFAVREGISTVYVRSSSYQKSFQWGMKCFIEEARVLARFNHPSIVKVLRFFEANGTAYMVMEYQQGKCLTDYLKEHNTLTEKELLAIVLPLLEGIKQIHNVSLLHRDIKPNNIYIRHDNTPVLLDFGSARFAVGQKTRSITTIVTPGYAPLEQYDNETSNQGPWTDIYALGAVMYHAISGKPPPTATSRVQKDPMIPAVKIGEGKYSKNLLQAIDWSLKVYEEKRPRTIEQWQRKFDSTLPLDKPLHQEYLLRKQRLFLDVAGIIIILLLLTTVGVLWQVYEHKLKEVVESTRQPIQDQLEQERSARKIAETKLEVEQRQRKEVEHQYLEMKAITEIIQRFEPQSLNSGNKPLPQFEQVVEKYYDVTNVPAQESLNIREFPGPVYKIMGEIPRTGKCVKYLEELRFIKTQGWVKVEYQGVSGWVNSYYLMRSSGSCLENSKIE